MTRRSSSLTVGEGEREDADLVGHDARRSGVAFQQRQLHAHALGGRAVRLEQLAADCALGSARTSGTSSTAAAT